MESQANLISDCEEKKYQYQLNQASKASGSKAGHTSVTYTQEATHPRS